MFPLSPPAHPHSSVWITDIFLSWEALVQLRKLCHQWLRQKKCTKEQILELLLLEHFLTVLPQEIQIWVRQEHPESGEEAVSLVEDLQKEPGRWGLQVRTRSLILSSSQRGMGEQSALGLPARWVMCSTLLCVKWHVLLPRAQ